MNKKAEVPWYLISFMLAVIVLIVVAFGFYLPKQNKLAKETDKLTDLTKIDSDLLNIKSFTQQEKEKCAKLSNLNDCTGSVNAKTGCFWGKTTSGLGCYSCTNNKYFNDDYGKCTAYISVSRSVVKGFEFQQICETNPCDFSSTVSEKKEKESCLFELKIIPNIGIVEQLCF